MISHQHLSSIDSLWQQFENEPFHDKKLPRHSWTRRMADRISGKESRIRLRRQDLSILEAMRERGYWMQSPELFVQPPGIDREPITQLLLAENGNGLISLPYWKTGKVYGTPHIEGLSFSWERRLVLLHEAGHCLFHGRLQPFQSLRVDSFISRNLNRWLFSPYHSSVWRDLLSEQFADTFAAAVILRETQHHPEAVASIQALKDYRFQQQHLAAGKYTLDIHHTAESLQRVLQTEWSETEPYELIEQVTQIASETWLTVMASENLVINQQEKKERLWQGACHAMKTPSLKTIFRELLEDQRKKSQRAYNHLIRVTGQDDVDIPLFKALVDTRQFIDKHDLSRITHQDFFPEVEFRILCSLIKKGDLWKEILQQATVESQVASVFFQKESLLRATEKPFLKTKPRVRM